MANELGAGLEFITSTLTGNTTIAATAGAIANGVAPEGTATPFIVYAQQSSMDVRGNGVFRLLNDALYRVTVSGKESDEAAINTLVGLVDGALQGQRNVTVTDGTVRACLREQTLELHEVTGSGDHWIHRVLLYRIFV